MMMIMMTMMIIKRNSIFELYDVYSLTDFFIFENRDINFCRNTK